MAEVKVCDKHYGKDENGELVKATMKIRIPKGPFFIALCDECYAEAPKKAKEFKAWAEDITGKVWVPPVPKAPKEEDEVAPQAL